MMRNLGYAARVVVLFLACAPAVFAQTQRTITARDLWQLKRVGAPVAAPDGSRAVFVVTTYDIDENKGNADLYVLRAGAEPLQLTASPANDHGPAWSPDSRRIAFVSGRAGDKAQLFVINADGGEARQVTKLPVAVSNAKWFPDGRRVAFIADVPPDFAGDFAALKQQLDERAKNKVSAHVTENRQYRYWDRWLTHGDNPRLFAADVETGKVTDLMPASKRYFDFDGAEYSIAPNGQEIAISANTTDAPYDSLNFDILLLRTDGSGTVKNITASNSASDFRPIYSPDGRSLVYGEKRDRHFYADRVRIVRYDRAPGQRVVLTEDVDMSPEQWVFSRDGRTLYFHAESRAAKPLYAMPLAGGTVREVYRGGTNDGVAVMSDRLLVLHQTLSRPPEIYEVAANGSGFRARTQFNDAAMAQLKLGAVEDVTFRAPDGASVQMYVVYPPDFDAAKKWPLVQQIHGGPHGTSGDVFHFRWNAHVFAAPGYVVALPNFRGSTSFGEVYTKSIHGDWAEKPFADVMASTDYLIGKGFIDERRMAATGGSYGGYMVAWIAGGTDRFAALINHAGVSNAQMEWASDADFLHAIGGSLWDKPEVMQRNNPILRAANFKTPMLIMHGGRDYRVPSDQALELYGVYKARGLDARLVFYPDENHWILSPQNSLHWYGEFLGWLERYIDKGPTRLTGR
jgi:dipeptidyl aminopeptidase/acylaminoacyl peptidase